MIDLSSKEQPARFDGIHVLVTGGTTGIGRAIAHRLVSEGANVFIFGRHEKELNDALAGANGGGGTLQGMVADQAHPAEVAEVFSEVDRRFPHLDVLVNNAAVGSDDFLEEDDAAITYAVQANVCGYIFCTRQAVRRMKTRKGGHIVNIGSITREKLKAGGEIYTATKAAIHAFSESSRKSLADSDIKVTLVEPGKTGSDLIDESVEEQREMQARLEMMKAEDVADAVCLCLTQSRRAVITSLQIEPARRQS